MGKKGIIKRVFAIAIALCMFCSVMPATSVVRANTDDGTTEESVDWDVSMSKQATNLDENYESEVTISLPADSYDGDLDVVIVLDGSTVVSVLTSPQSDEAALINQAVALLDSLLEYENLNVKVGVVIFGGSTPIVYQYNLAELNDETYADLISDIYSQYTTLMMQYLRGTIGLSGSNLQAGVEAAREMLNGDTDVDASDKYMIVLTDGGARMWYDTETEEAMSQTYIGDTTEVYWNSNNDWLWRYTASADAEIRSFEEIWEAGQNGTNIGAYGMTTSEAASATSTSEGIASKDTVVNSDDYYTTYEAACYYAATSIVAASEEANVIMVTYPYYSNRSYTNFAESFKSWLADEGYVTRYDSSEATAETIFASVEDQLVQRVDAGSIVVDEIGYGTDSEGNEYDFNFVNDIDKLTLTVGDETYTVTQIDDYSYGFGDATGSADGSTYPFVLTYYPDGYTTDDGTEYGECYVFEINIAVTKEMTVQLTYSVVLTNPQEDAGTYGTYDQYGDNNDGSESYSLYTNNVATLYAVDSNGNIVTPEDFQKPTVSYEIVNISVTKEWDDSDDQDGKRPESITVNLLADGEIIDSVEVTEEDDWTYEFTGLRQWDDDDEGYEAIEYTVTENYIDEYESAISGDAETGYVVTNSYEPETLDIEISKIFDESDKDGAAHDSVTITLYANGVSTGKTITLSDDNNWYGTFTDLAKYEDGVEIEYTIKESKVSGNTSIITGDTETGFTITTYTSSSVSSGSSTSSSSATDDETDTTEDTTSKTTEITTSTSEDTSVSTTSVDGETENSSFKWYIPVAGVGVIAVIGAVIYLKKREEVTE